jgi:hypothetical protein
LHRLEIRDTRIDTFASKEWMRFERVRKVLLDPQHLGRLITVHRATYIALNAEGAIERWNRHISIGKAKWDAVFEQEIVHQVIQVILTKDDPTVISIFPHTSLRFGSQGWVGTAVGAMISKKSNDFSKSSKKCSHVAQLAFLGAKNG